MGQKFPLSCSCYHESGGEEREKRERIRRRRCLFLFLLSSIESERQQNVDFFLSFFLSFRQIDGIVGVGTFAAASVWRRPGGAPAAIASIFAVDVVCRRRRGVFFFLFFFLGERCERATTSAVITDVVDVVNDDATFTSPPSPPRPAPPAPRRPLARHGRLVLLPSLDGRRRERDPASSPGDTRPLARHLFRRPRI